MLSAQYALLTILRCGLPHFVESDDTLCGRGLQLVEMRLMGLRLQFGPTRRIRAQSHDVFGRLPRESNRLRENKDQFRLLAQKHAFDRVDRESAKQLQRNDRLFELFVLGEIVDLALVE